MSSFRVDWLDRREDADRRARDGGLLARARRWLTAVPQPVAVDLGAGTGATVRALAGSGTEPLTWRLVDHDRGLLAEAERRHGGRHRIETCPADLTRVDTLPLDGARLVTASALFDLVSAGFIESLAAAISRQNERNPVGLYSALTYDGMTHWTPVHPLDDAVLAAFNRDQGRDKGFGPALGPEAGTCMEHVFRRAGFVVQTADSPWVLDGTDHRLVSDLIDGIAGAVARDPALDAAALEEWKQFRHQNVLSGTCTVGHTDVLALPELP